MINLPILSNFNSRILDFVNKYQRKILYPTAKEIRERIEANFGDTLQGIRIVKNSNLPLGFVTVMQPLDTYMGMDFALSEEDLPEFVCGSAYKEGQLGKRLMRDRK